MRKFQDGEQVVIIGRPMPHAERYCLVAGYSDQGHKEQYLCVRAFSNFAEWIDADCLLEPGEVCLDGELGDFETHAMETTIVREHEELAREVGGKVAEECGQVALSIAIQALRMIRKKT